MIDEKLKQFATDIQWKYYQEYAANNSFGQTAKVFKKDRKTISRSIKTMFKKAELQGYSPEHSMNKTVPDSYTVKGVSTYYDDKGAIKGQWVKSSINKEEELKAIQATIEGLTADIKPLENIPKTNGNHEKDRISCIPLPDMHIGLLCEKELVNEGWDVKTAIKAYKVGMLELIDSLPKTEKVLIVNLGDLSHQNDSSKLTPQNKHVLDVDGRIEKTVRACAEFMRFTIDECLKKYKTIEFRNILGNHSGDIEMAVNVTLGMLYENTDRVIIPKTSQIRDYFKFGKNIIGMTHHGKGKPDNLGLLMAQECRNIWSSTEFSYFWTAHIHSMTKFETQGVEIESFRTLIPRDKWTFTQGYLSGKQLTGIIYDAEYGECGRRIVGIKKIKDLQK